MSKKWVINNYERYDKSNGGSYTGDTYVVQGDLYAVFSKEEGKAKKYSSEKRALKAKEALENKVWNYDELKVEEAE